MMDSKIKLVESIRKKREYIKWNKLEFYDPYQFQVDFHNDVSDRVGLLASNQTGKTRAGTAQDALDATGLYPDWYEGRKFDHPVHIVCGCFNNDLTRDILQDALCGDPTNKEESLGTGWLPRHCVSKKRISLKRGVTDAYIHVMVKHHTDGRFDGWSKITFATYEAGKEAWMGSTVDIYHGDEECKMEILAQMGRGCIATGGIIRMTFTPENGETDVLMKVRDEWSMHSATFADIAGEKCSFTFEDGEVLSLEPVYTMRGRIGHINNKTLVNLAKDNPPWMLKTRMLGLPMIGEGFVFAYPESQLKVEPMEFPDYFKFIDAIDFGGLSSTAHPTAFIRIAYDPQMDVIYVYDAFRMKGAEIPEISASIIMKPNSDIVPVIWPHDGNKIIGQGESTKDQYLSCGVNMYEGNGAKSHFTNPPSEYKEEGTGGIQIIPGITEMSARIGDGRFKAMSTVLDFWDEFRRYHMKKGKIVDENDDIMSAVRYGVQSIRHAVLLEHVSIAFNQNNRSSGKWMAG